MARRRRFTRSFAGKKGSRRFFWFRFTPFSLALQEAATATHSTILLNEADYYDPTNTLNETQRGGPRLERMIMQYGLSVEANTNFLFGTGSGQTAQIPEFMVHKQNDQFATVVTDSASFDSTRENHRVIMDEVAIHNDGPHRMTDGPPPTYIRTTVGEYETKSKVRLADGALVVSWRGFFNTADAALNEYTDWVRPTMLISLP